jgi:hypothetical protein
MKNNLFLFTPNFIIPFVIKHLKTKKIQIQIYKIDM